MNATTSAWKSPKVITFRGKVIIFITGFKILNPIVIRIAAVKIPQNPPLTARPEKIFKVANSATELIAVSCKKPFMQLEYHR